VKLVLRLGAAAVVAGSAAVGFVPVAAAATSTTMTPSTEAWYQPNPTCAAPPGCVTTGSLPAAPPTTVPTSPYPAGTLHVGFGAGQETARSYLALPFSALSGTVQSASLDIPLDTSAGDGSSSPETAHVQACLFSGALAPADGSVDAPPTASCAQSAALSYLATPAPHLHADLGPLSSELLSATGLALLPDATKSAATDSWRVVFSAHTLTDSARTAPASVTVAVDEPTAGGGIPVDVPTQPATGIAVQPAPNTGFASQPMVPAAPLDSGGVPTVAGTTAPVAGVPVAAPRTITVGYAYPVVWLLPLLLLVVVPLIARLLTSDLTGRPVQEISGDAVVPLA
jgi:hypothetical protein